MVVADAGGLTIPTHPQSRFAHEQLDIDRDTGMVLGQSLSVRFSCVLLSHHKHVSLNFQLACFQTVTVESKLFSMIFSIFEGRRCPCPRRSAHTMAFFSDVDLTKFLQGILLTSQQISMLKLEGQ